MQRLAARIAKASRAQIQKRNQNDGRNHNEQNPCISSRHVKHEATEDNGNANDEDGPNPPLELCVTAELEKQEAAKPKSNPEDEEDGEHSSFVGLPSGLRNSWNHSRCVR